MRTFTAICAIVLLIIIVVFAFQNRVPVDVLFLAWSLSMPKIFLILGTYVLGMLSGWGLVELLKTMF